MTSTDNLINQIQSIDKKISASQSEEVDINDDQWLEKLNEKITFENDATEKEIIKLRDALVATFEHLSLPEREIVWCALHQNQYTRDQLHYAPGRGNFGQQIILWIIRDLGNDTRDELLTLKDIWQSNPLPVNEKRAVVREYIKFADTKDRHGLGSASELLINL